jgi:hypothetical protein
VRPEAITHQCRKAHAVSPTGRADPPSRQTGITATGLLACDSTCEPAEIA